MATSARVAGHPIHPMLVPFPIALWIFSLIADFLFRGGGGLVWNDLAFYTMAAGLVGALLAAIPGLLDYRTLVAPRVRQLATAHLTLNLLLVALYAVNLWLRMRTAPGEPLPFWMSVAGVALLLVSGWLGGELVFGHGVGVEPEPGRLEARIEAERRADTRARGA
jgi:uncharacterized membrane protein